MKNALFLLTALTALPSVAHEGHGLVGGHWHATDVLGFVVIGVVALAIWWSRK
jgi:hypothetical protein